MSRPVRLVLVGIGGFGKSYVNALLDSNRDDFTIVGAVDPKPENCPRLEELKALNVPIYADLEAFYQEHTSELAVISSPIQFHAPQSCMALEKGSHVLCEKPIAATIQEALAMLEAEKKNERFLAIGYQWSFSAAVQALKRDAMAGKFGRPKRLKNLVLWSRGRPYYTRSSWAAVRKDSAGRWVLDSVANNATAHYLHNMFYVLGAEVHLCQKPAVVQAELYRANAIENFDTGIVRAVTEEGVEVLYYGSHAVLEERYGPQFVYEFENATITYAGSGHTITAAMDTGETLDYGDPDLDRNEKLWECIEAVQSGRTVLACGVLAGIGQTLAINGMHESVPTITTFPQELICHEPTGEVTWVDGLSKALHDCYDNWRLPHELKYAWAQAGETIELKDYTCFPSLAHQPD